MTTDPNCVNCFYAGGIYAPLPLWVQVVMWAPTVLIFWRMLVWNLRNDANNPERGR